MGSEHPLLAPSGVEPSRGGFLERQIDHDCMSQSTIDASDLYVALAGSPKSASAITRPPASGQTLASGPE